MGQAPEKERRMGDPFRQKRMDAILIFNSIDFYEFTREIVICLKLIYKKIKSGTILATYF